MLASDNERLTWGLAAAAIVLVVAVWMQVGRYAEASEGCSHRRLGLGRMGAFLLTNLVLVAGAFLHAPRSGGSAYSLLAPLLAGEVAADSVCVTGC